MPNSPQPWHIRRGSEGSGIPAVWINPVRVTTASRRSVSALASTSMLLSKSRTSARTINGDIGDVLAPCAAQA